MVENDLGMMFSNQWTVGRLLMYLDNTKEATPMIGGKIIPSRRNIKKKEVDVLEDQKRGQRRISWRTVIEPEDGEKER